jgi:hypothetical protein
MGIGKVITVSRNGHVLTDNLVRSVVFQFLCPTVAVLAGEISFPNRVTPIGPLAHSARVAILASKVIIVATCQPSYRSGMCMEVVTYKVGAELLYSLMTAAKMMGGRAARTRK